MNFPLRQWAEFPGIGKYITFNHGVEGSSPSALTIESIT
jgi:hypothetical protein